MRTGVRDNVGRGHATRSIVFSRKLIGCAYLNPSSIELYQWNIFIVSLLLDI